jgi:hypothetical protein
MEDTLDGLPHALPNVVLADVDLPDMSGVD